MTIPSNCYALERVAVLLFGLCWSILSLIARLSYWRICTTAVYTEYIKRKAGLFSNFRLECDTSGYRMIYHPALISFPDCHLPRRKPPKQPGELTEKKPGKLTQLTILWSVVQPGESTFFVLARFTIERPNQDLVNQPADSSQREKKPDASNSVYSVLSFVRSFSFSKVWNPCPSVSVDMLFLISLSIVQKVLLSTTLQDHHNIDAQWESLTMRVAYWMAGFDSLIHLSNAWLSRKELKKETPVLRLIFSFFFFSFIYYYYFLFF